MSRLLQGRLRRSLARRQAAFLTLLTLLVVLSSVLVFVTTAPGNGGNPSGGDRNVTAAAEEAVAPESKGSPGKVSLGLGGDVTFALEMAQLVEAYGPDYPWRNLGDLLREYPLSVVNLEGPLCSPVHKASSSQASYPMRGDVSCAPAMAEAGIDGVCLGNDHAMDFGSPGLEEALNVLRMAGIVATGAGPSLRAALQPAVLREGEGGEVAILSFSDVGPASYAAGEDRAGVAPAEAAVVEEAVRRAAGEYPYVVVFMHWGEIGSAEVTDRQRELASICARSGADLVVGCHPHVVQGMEVVEGVPVFYSLGNLVFYSQGEEGKRGIFLGCRFADGRLERVEIFPVLIEAGRPEPMSGSAAEDFLRAWSARCPGEELGISERNGRIYLQWAAGP